MGDISILIIKPEVFIKKFEIERSLEKRGYEIIKKIEKFDWRHYCKEIYNEFLPEEIQTYINGYDKHQFGERFLILILRHREGNTLERLKIDKGNFIKYQNEDEKTLRAEFGLSKEFNIRHGNITFVFNGIHSPENINEQKFQLKLFSLNNYI